MKQFFNKSCNVHGARHPELFQINEQFYTPAGALALYRKKEEFMLFPHIKKLVAPNNKHEQAVKPGFGTVQNSIQVMMQELDAAGEGCREIVSLSDHDNPPAHAYTTYRAAFFPFKEMEDDLHPPIHLENNIPFPNAVT